MLEDDAALHSKDNDGLDVFISFRFNESQREALEDELAKAHEQVETARDIVSQAFEELKKYEITKDQQDHREYLEQERQNQIELNEVALTAHQRKGSVS